MSAERPPVLLLSEPSTLERAPLPPGWTPLDGFTLPAEPWDVSAKRWICVGRVLDEFDAATALGVLVRGAGLALVVEGPPRLRHRVLDDLHHLGSVRRIGDDPSSRQAREPFPGLEADDRRLMAALAGGATVEASARAVNVSTRTAQRRLAIIRRRLGASNTTEAVDRWLAGRPDQVSGWSS